MSVMGAMDFKASPDEILASGEYPLTRRDLSEIAAMIYSDAGISLNESKASLVYSRLSKHIRALGLAGFRDYCQLVSSPAGSAARREMLDALLATGIPFAGRPGHAQFLKELHQISAKVSGVRRFGSAALDLAWVAAGRYDGYWERRLNAWDIAAGALLVTEAGGKVTTADGGEFDVREGTVLASNLELHPQILELLKAAA